MKKLLSPYALPTITKYFKFKAALPLFYDELCPQTKKLRETLPFITTVAKYQYCRNPYIDEHLTKCIGKKDDWHDIREARLQDGEWFPITCPPLEEQLMRKSMEERYSLTWSSNEYEIKHYNTSSNKYDCCMLDEWSRCKRFI